MQGASNKQLEHATMVLLQTVEDLSACHYKGTISPLLLFKQSFTVLERDNQQLRGENAVVKLAAYILATYSVCSCDDQDSTLCRELLRIVCT